MTPLRIDLVEGGRIALGSLVGNRLRTLLTTLGIGVGVATLLAILGIIQGLDRSFADQLASLGSSSLYVSKFPWVITDDWWKYRNRKDFDPSLVDALREQATLATAVAPSFARHGSVSLLGQSLSRVRIVGTTADYPTVAGVELTAGRFLSDADSENRKAVVVIGADVAEGLFPQADPLGTTIRIRGVPFLVVGTLARQGALFGQSRTCWPSSPSRPSPRSSAAATASPSASRSRTRAAWTRPRISSSASSAAPGRPPRTRPTTSRSTGPSSSRPPTSSSPRPCTAWPSASG